MDSLTVQPLHEGQVTDGDDTPPLGSSRKRWRMMTAWRARARLACWEERRWAAVVCA